MSWINFNGKRYSPFNYRIQCLSCSSIVQGFDDSCNCGLILLKNGQRTWPCFPVRNVSIWKSSKGDVLPQHVLDHYFNLSRETNETRTYTETCTRAS